MDAAESARMCAQYHVARARLLVDCLRDSEAVKPQTLETTLRMIRAELDAASTALGATPPRMARARVDLRGFRPVIEF